MIIKRLYGVIVFFCFLFVVSTYSNTHLLVDVLLNVPNIDSSVSYDLDDVTFELGSGDNQLTYSFSNYQFTNNVMSVALSLDNFQDIDGNIVSLMDRDEALDFVTINIIIDDDLLGIYSEEIDLQSLNYAVRSTFSESTNYITAASIDTDGNADNDSFLGFYVDSDSNLLIQQFVDPVFFVSSNNTIGIGKYPDTDDYALDVSGSINIQDAFGGNNNNYYIDGVLFQDTLYWDFSNDGDANILTLDSEVTGIAINKEVPNYLLDLNGALNIHNGSLFRNEKRLSAVASWVTNYDSNDIFYLNENVDNFVGIGLVSPEEVLDIEGGIVLSLSETTNPEPGTIYYDLLADQFVGLIHNESYSDIQRVTLNVADGTGEEDHLASWEDNMLTFHPLVKYNQLKNYLSFGALDVNSHLHIQMDTHSIPALSIVSSNGFPLINFNSARSDYVNIFKNNYTLNSSEIDDLVMDVNGSVNASTYF